MRTARKTSQDRGTPSLAIALGVLAASASARADDWLTARHDAQRTGRVAGPARLSSPAVRWRHYLGGGVRGNLIVTADVDGDLTTDIVYVSSGKLRCKHADDALVWEGEALDLQSIVGVADLDGDARSEVVAVGSRGLVGVFEGATGRMLWEVPTAMRGGGASARLADLDGDGVTDLYVGECVRNPVAAAGFSFRGGFAAARELWRVLPAAVANGCGTDGDAIGDLDGDGAPEVVLTLGFDRMYVFDARTGRARFEVPAPASSPFGGFTWTMLRQLDDDPALELVAFTNGYARIATPYGARRIAVYEQAPGGMRLAWEQSLPSPEGAELRFEATSVRDLDGDGAPEITVSELDATTRAWTLVVRSARDGRTLARQAGADLVGLEDPLGDGRPVILTVDDDRGLVARRFTGAGFTAAWSIPAARPLRYTDAALLARERAAARPLLVQLDDDPALELIAAPFDPALPPESRVVTEVTGYDLAGDAPRPLGTYRAPLGATVGVATSGERLSRPYAQTVLVTSDGYLLALDRAMAPTNRVVGAEFTVPGMRVGGFYAGANAGAAPIAGALARGGGERAVIVRDSRPVLVRLDVAGATLAAPPRVRWERPNLGPAMIADVNGDGAREVVALDGRDVVALAPDGAREVWRSREAAGPVGSRTLYDVLPLRRADGAVDVFFGRLDPSNVYRPTALRGADGALRWNTFSRTPSSGFCTFALDDLTGDGTDDVFAAINTMTVLDGERGAVVVDREGAPYATPVIAPFSGAEPEVYVGGAFLADRLVSRRLEVRGTLDNGTFSLPFGALVRCGDANAIAVTPNSSAEVVVVRPQALPVAGAPGPAVLARAALAGGSRFADEASVTPGARKGTFGSLTAVVDLDGRGTQALLVGSTDGWLYALDACTLALLWSMDFYEPVGEAVVADTDGDGADDVMVTVGDGYLYGLGPRTLPATDAVRDLDASGEDDVDEVEAFDTLRASWSAVPGAEAYLVRALSYGGSALRFPESVQVTGTRVEVRELPLLFGGRYRVGVTALRGDGSGVEVLSDGVTVVDRSPPTIELRLSRPSFAPRALETVDISVDTSDRTGLARSRAELRDAGGSLVRVLDDYEARVRDASRSARVTWGGTDERGVVVPDGTYTVVATATDVGGATTTARAMVQLIAPSVTTPSTGFAPGRDVGCQCGARRGEAPYGALALLALPAMMLRRRRRR
jgi:outer membrane protein assembly factor BamB